MPKAIADGHLLYLIFVCLVAMRTALKILRKSFKKSYELSAHLLPDVQMKKDFSQIFK